MPVGPDLEEVLDANEEEKKDKEKEVNEEVKEEEKQKDKMKKEKRKAKEEKSWWQNLTTLSVIPRAAFLQ